METETHHNTDHSIFDDPGICCKDMDQAVAERNEEEYNEGGGACTA